MFNIFNKKSKGLPAYDGPIYLPVYLPPLSDTNPSFEELKAGVIAERKYIREAFNSLSDEALEQYSLSIAKQYNNSTLYIKQKSEYLIQGRLLTINATYEPFKNQLLIELEIKVIEKPYLTVCKTLELDRYEATSTEHIANEIKKFLKGTVENKHD